MFLINMRIKKWCQNYSRKFVLDCYKIQALFSQAVNTTPSEIQSVPELYKTKEMYDKVVDTGTFVFHSSPD